ncbi:MAG: DUF1302 domain-containing protein [Pseudomonadota bacterium]
MTAALSCRRLAALPLAVSLASGVTASLMASLATPVFGATFSLGEVEGQFDSSLSVGASWALRSADPDLIGVNNGGRGLSQTTDDSHLNFKRGETFSKIFKGVHDLELKYADTGVFLRGKYWYDVELKDEHRLFKDIDDDDRKEAAQASGAQLLDAFVYHSYAIADKPGSVRLGKQVLSWGESTFIGNSINSVNPIDAAAFRRPGAEIREGLIPVNMFYVAQSLTDSLSAEAFYQLEWDQTIVDNCGTFFAQADIIADGCDDNLRLLSNDPVRQRVVNGIITNLNAAPGQPFGTIGAINGNAEGNLVARSGDRDARDSGQWGAALRYFAQELNTEFGVYALNYHSRTPVFSATAPAANVYAGADSVYSPAAATTLGPAAALIVASNASYFIEYPEDLRLYGLSFSTTLPSGTAWSGEVSYRPNAPVQLNTTDILFAAVRPIENGTSIFADASVLSGTPGADLHGYRRKEITQLQTTFTHFVDRVMGASRMTLVGELGFVHVGGLDRYSEARYGRDPVYGPGALPDVAALGGATNTCPFLNTLTVGGSTTPDTTNIRKNCNNDGFVTRNAWGYRARVIWDYSSALAGINLRPSLAWSHDVDGYGPNALFTEGSKALSLGLDADYQNTYTASLAYTEFFGGKFNTSVDRDFVALSFGANF